jgi:hypothetical protein
MDRDELRATIVDRDEEIERLKNELARAAQAGNDPMK